MSAEDILPEASASHRVVVVGASAGIGRSFARSAIAAGHDVVLSSRRADALETVVADAGGGQVLTVDVADPASRASFAAALAEGPAVDLLLVTVGMADLRLLADTDDAVWATTLATNLVGVARLLSEVRPLLAPDGIAAVMSTETGRRPRTGLVPYGAAKVGLEAVLEGLRIEHPGLRVSCIVVGATFPTEFGSSFAPDVLGPAMEDWQHHGRLQQEFMKPAEVAAVLLDVYTTALRHPSVGIEEITVRSPSPVLGATSDP